MRGDVASRFVEGGDIGLGQDVETESVDATDERRAELRCGLTNI